MTVYSNETGPIYKYQRLSGEYGRRAVEGVLRDNLLFWQSPLAFNDPFDCAPRFLFGKTPRDRERFAKAAAATHLKDGTRSTRRIARRRALALSEERHRLTLIKGFNNWMARVSVTCFSKVANVPLMWAHYGDSHQGVCFEFKEKLSPTPFIAFDVTYSEMRPTVDLTKILSPNTFEDTLLTKSADWSYEHEKRMIGPLQPPGSYNFPPECLVSVTLGSRISAQDRDFVIELVAKRIWPIAVYSASVCPQTYGILIERIK